VSGDEGEAAGRRWSLPLRTGSVAHTLLALLADRPHPVSYLVLAAKTEGIYTTEGQILEILSELEAEGHVESRWQNGANGLPQRVHALTARGRERLDSLRGAISSRQADY
jgi:DNA-binding PadR family transcriptional regulator